MSFLKINVFHICSRSFTKQHLEYVSFCQHQKRLDSKTLYAYNFDKMHIKFREPVILPKTIPLHIVKIFLTTIYQQHACAKTVYQQKNTLRDIAVIELLFSTGVRISELCALNITDVNLEDGIILIYGKGAKKRCMHVGNPQVLSALATYKEMFYKEMQVSKHFFVNLSGTALSDQAVRRMINKYTALASIELHITPHMFRHTFTTFILLIISYYHSLI